MDNYFPADVSLRVAPGSDLSAAQRLFPQARQLLFRALKLRDSGTPVVRLLMPFTDGSLVQAFLIGQHKHLYVQPAKLAPPIEVPLEPVVVAVGERTLVADMRNGVVYPGTKIAEMKALGEQALLPDGTLDWTLHEFHPTPLCAAIYDLVFDWQDINRLGVERDPDIGNTTMQARWPKPSMFSGAMKRVVQALYGIGKVFNGTLTDLQGDDEAFAQTTNHYDFRWERTHGIIKFEGTHYLIEVSRERGVLAMPLPIFSGTEDDGYRDNLADLGDTESLFIVDEFKGLPSGEAFPEDDPDAFPPVTDLSDAITAGSVLRLISAEDLAPFYADEVSETNKRGFFPGCGWAFSHSGETLEAHNTCWWYSRPDIVALPFMTWATDGHNGASPLDRYMRAEHWKIAFEFVRDEDGNLVVTAELVMVEEQPFEAPNSINLWYEPPDFRAPLHLHVVPFLCGHYPVTGAVGASGGGPVPVDPGPPYYATVSNQSYPVGTLLASGMDPLRFPDQFLPMLSGGLGRDATQIGWVSHKALMMVPREDDTDRLDRFTFWGRSQSAIRLVDMEPAYEAPVLVFFNGEELEIVRRKAERYSSDRETITPFDDVPGIYYPGDFFATSLNMLDPIQTNITTAPGYVANHTLFNHSMLPPHFAVVGLIIPAGCREGYVFVKAAFDSDNLAGVGGEVTTVKGFFPALGGVIDFVEFTSNHLDTYLVPNFGALVLGKYEQTVFPGWWAMWTNLYFEFNLGIDNTGIRFGASISAGPSSNHVMHAEPRIGWRLLDVPFYYRLGQEFPMSASLPGLPAVYRRELPDGVSLDANVNPIDVTFVGAV